MELWGYFPQHKMRIELFFGAGGAFFNMPRSRYHILNDFDDDVTNLYEVVCSDRHTLSKAIEMMPISSSLVKKWKNQTFQDPIKKALRFLLLSNFTYLGKGDTLRLSIDNTKELLLGNIEKTFEALKNEKITNLDFREVIPKISFSKKLIPERDAFVYLDPIYLDTDHYYRVPKWTADDTIDCLDIMSNSGLNCAMSEFNHPLIMEESAKRGFEVIPIKERQNIKNRKMEVLIVNYDRLNLFSKIDPITKKLKS